MASTLESQDSGIVLGIAAILKHLSGMMTLEPGDIIAIPASGAYAPAMASNYNLNPRPALVMVGGGEARLIRRRESFEDMMALDVAD